MSISHTGQLFFNDTLTDSVALISPYSNHTITRTLNSQDSIYATSNGSVTFVSIAQNSANNYTRIVTLGVNSSATPAAVGSGEMGPGIGQMPPNQNNFSMPLATMTFTATTVQGAATTFCISLSSIIFVLLLHI
jgi:hypothetical protein